MCVKLDLIQRLKGQYVTIIDEWKGSGGSCGLTHIPSWYLYVSEERLEDLDYADDICLSAQRFYDMDEKLDRLKVEAELAGLHININKTRG